MIICHSHKFIFIKSLKTAGTSLEAALSQHCGGDDVVVPINAFGHNRDEKGDLVHRDMNADEVYRRIGQHVDAAGIKARVPESVWNGYFKFSITRNPWDRALSYFFWDRRKDPSLKPRKRFYHYLGVPFDEFAIVKDKFSRFVRARALRDTQDERHYVSDGAQRYRVPAEGFLENNDRFYVIDDQLCADFVIRYEHLEEDYNEVCRRIGVPAAGLPQLKAGIRKQGRHFTEYYDDATRDLVDDLHRNDQRFFGYRFGQ
jgi:hypothetical protein